MRSEGSGKILSFTKRNPFAYFTAASWLIERNCKPSSNDKPEARSNLGAWQVGGRHALFAYAKQAVVGEAERVWQKRSNLLSALGHATVWTESDKDTPNWSVSCTHLDLKGTQA